MSGQVFNGQQTFMDLNGDPLAGGQVFFYVPGTTTPKTTWVDSGFTVANTNPIILDQAGRATIWGQGAYREIVVDQFGNTQWDQVTDASLSTTVITSSLTVDGPSIFNGNTTVNGTETVNGPFNVNGVSTLGAVNADGPITAPTGTGGMQLDNGVVINSDAGQTVALTTNGGIQLNGTLGMNGPIVAPAGTGGLVVDNGMVINPSPGQLTALTTNAGIQCNGPLGVTNGINVTGGASSFAGSITCAHDITATGNVNAQSVLPTVSASGEVGSTTQPFGSMFAGVFTVTPSDRNLKSNVSALDFDGIGVVKSAGVYEYSVGDRHNIWGLMAQDLDIATNGAMGSDGTLTLNGLVAVLWKALQEMEEKINRLEHRLVDAG